MDIHEVLEKVRSGELSVEGEIDSVSYQAKLSRKAGILARVFK